MRWQKIFFVLSVVAVLTTLASFERPTQAARDITKKEESVVTENISRSRVKIERTIRLKGAPSFLKSGDVDFDRARVYSIDKKTLELIDQIEKLIKRPGQKERSGELKMRLASLYFDRSQAVAAKESESWERLLKAWESLPDSTRQQRPRPELRTPRATSYRQKALTLYRNLERVSRGPGRGADMQIQRDEVLYFLASTLVDLGKSKEAVPFYSELVSAFLKSPRLFSARLNLADLLFERNEFSKAIPLYLRVAAGENIPQGGADQSHLKAYALYKLGWCYMNTAEHNKAVLAFKRTLEVSAQSQTERRIVFEREATEDLGRAFALAEKFDEGEQFFGARSGDDRTELLANFRIQAAETARDRGLKKVALDFYDKLIAMNPRAPAARDYALEKVQLVQKQDSVEAYQGILASFAKDYGAGSKWFEAQPAGDERTQLGLELVGLLRREAKNQHRSAQLKNRNDLFEKSRKFYEIYFEYVPQPNSDSDAHLNEMRFYFAELLFRLQDFKGAASQYAQAASVAGRFQNAGAYARILALRQGVQKDASLSKELGEATEAFVKANPKDPRANELLYSSAQESFKAGDKVESIDTLKSLVAKVPEQAVAVEAAERILFIHEKNKALVEIVKDGQEFLSNAVLIKTGGPEFQAKLKGIIDSARFKTVELMPQDSDSEKQKKGQSFFVLSAALNGDLKEKALNNAAFFATSSKDSETAQKARAVLVADFPKSGFAKDLLLDQADAQLAQGQFREALKTYGQFVERFSDKAKADQKMAVAWNQILIQAHLEDAWDPDLNPDRGLSPALMKALGDYIGVAPAGDNRKKAIEILAHRKDVSLKDVLNLKTIKKLAHKLSGAELAVLDRAERVLSLRKSWPLATLIKKYPPQVGYDGLTKQALGLAAFDGVEEHFAAYLKTKIDYQPNRFAKSLQKKLQALEKLEQEYMTVVGYGDGDTALESLERLFRMYRQISQDIERAPGQKSELEIYSKPLFEKAVGFLRTCLDKGAELKIAGAGLRSCRISAFEVGADFGNLSHDLLPEPKWISSATTSQSPLLNAALAAAQGNRWGEVDLALRLLNDQPLQKSNVDALVAKNLEGLMAYRSKNLQAATKAFLQATEAPSVKSLAQKNLAALYLNVGDFDQAIDTLGSVQSDADAWHLLALAQKGTGDLGDSLKSFEKALAANPNAPALVFNAALALGSSNMYRAAALKMSRYIELESPSQQHVSRQLFKLWKEKSNDKIPE